MRRLTALVWKEFRELRWFLVVGLLLFFGVPLVVALCGVDGSALTRELILWFGAATVVFVAVGIVCRDFSDDLRIFWRSRPLPVAWLLSVKWVAGLLVVVAVTCLPLAVLLVLFPYDEASYRNILHWDHRSTFAMLACHTFVLVAVYGVAFFLSCLLRRGAHAAVLSLAAGLLLYLGPSLIPPLGFLDVFDVMGRLDFTSEWFGQYRAFCAGLLACIAATAALAGLAVWRDWRVRIGGKAIAWLLAGVLLLTLGVNAFQLGANLEVIRRVTVRPPGTGGARGIVHVVATEDGRGALLLRRWGKRRREHYSLCKFEITDTDIELGPEVDLPGVNNAWHFAWAPQEPGRAYLLATEWKEDSGQDIYTHELITVALDAAAGGPGVSRTRLERPEFRRMRWRSPFMYKGMLYFLSSRGRSIARLDVADPNAPLDIMEIPAWYEFGWFYLDREPASAYSMRVPSIPSLTRAERLHVTLHLSLAAHSGRSVSLTDGDVLAMERKGGLSVYRLGGPEGNRAELTLIGYRQRTPLEKLAVVKGWESGIVVTKGGMAYTGSYWQRRLTVFDLAEPEHPRRVAHFVLPKDRTTGVVPLDGNRLLVAGWRDLYLLKLPRKD